MVGRRRNSALASTAFGERLGALPPSSSAEERVAPAYDNSTSDGVSPIAVDRARPLIEGKLTPYLYELIHNQASCPVSHFRALTGKFVKEGVGMCIIRTTSVWKVGCAINCFAIFLKLRCTFTLK